MSNRKWRNNTMISIQHTALYYLALYSARNAYNPDFKSKLDKEFQDEVPYVVLPDGIRAYSGPRPISHFEKTPDGNGVSYMRFPSEDLPTKIPTNGKTAIGNLTPRSLRSNMPGMSKRGSA